MPLRQRAALKCQQFCWQWALLRPRGDQLLHDSPKKEASWKLRDEVEDGGSGKCHFCGNIRAMKNGVFGAGSMCHSL